MNQIDTGKVRTLQYFRCYGQWTIEWGEDRNE